MSLLADRLSNQLRVDTAEGKSQSASENTALSWFSRAIFVHLIAKSILNLKEGYTDEALTIFEILICGISVIGLLPSYLRLAASAVSLLLLCELAFLFPLGANHRYVEIFCCVVLAVYSISDKTEAELMGTVLRFMAIAVLFYSGMQKLMHGWYFRGEMLTELVARRGEFTDVLGWTLPASELERIKLLGTVDYETGPFRPQGAPLFIFASNLVYITELLAAVMLFSRRFRKIGAFFALAVVLFS